MTLTKNEIKFVKSLQIKKYRDSQQLFVVEGEKLVNDLLSQSNYKIDTLFHTNEFKPNDAIQTYNSIIVNDKDLERMSSLKTPNKVLATVKMQINKAINIEDNKLILLLDNVKDPGNLGTIIRTAEWFGIKRIIASNQSVDIFNPKTIQASMGAFYHVHFTYSNLNLLLPNLKEKDYVIVGASLTGSNLYNTKLANKTALVMGSESHGISPEILSLLDQELLIPQTGTTESLNVGIATGIFLSEYYRQTSTLQK
ncbi:MAG: TrmH family RNA methyltransferase [Crocinitomicaceae bacterium]